MIDTFLIGVILSTFSDIVQIYFAQYAGGCQGWKSADCSWPVLRLYFTVGTRNSPIKGWAIRPRCFSLFSSMGQNSVHIDGKLS